MFRAKLKEAVICFKAGRVTLPYPFAPSDVPPKFRGRIEFDARKRPLRQHGANERAGRSSDADVRAAV